MLQPLQGAKDEGISGFFKGTLKGLGGALVKPVAGVFDATAKAAEGLKNTATHFDDKPNDVRLRDPRPFYEKEMYLKTYNQTHAEIIINIQIFKSGKYSKKTFFDSFILNNPRENVTVFLLILTLEAILLIGKNSKRLEWEIQPKLILKIEEKTEKVEPHVVDIFITFKYTPEDYKVKENLLSFFFILFKKL